MFRRVHLPPFSFMRGSPCPRTDRLIVLSLRRRGCGISSIRCTPACCHFEFRHGPSRSRSVSMAPRMCCTCRVRIVARTRQGPPTHQFFELCSYNGHHWGHDSGQVTGHPSQIMRALTRNDVIQLERKSTANFSLGGFFACWIFRYFEMQARRELMCGLRVDVSLFSLQTTVKLRLSKSENCQNLLEPCKDCTCCCGRYRTRGCCTE